MTGGERGDAADHAVGDRALVGLGERRGFDGDHVRGTVRSVDPAAVRAAPPVEAADAGADGVRGHKDLDGAVGPNDAGLGGGRIERKDRVHIAAPRDIYGVKASDVAGDKMSDLVNRARELLARSR